MAIKTVCDMCGKDATGKRTIDVCDDHARSDSTVVKADRRSAPKPMVKCPKCGEMFKAGAGLSAHMRRAHAPRKKATAKKR